MTLRHHLASPRTLASAVALGVIATLTVSQAWANDAALDRVELQAHREAPAQAAPDLRQQCPGVDAQLQDALASAWFREQSDAVLDVRYVIDATGVHDVNLRNGAGTGVSSPYASAVRRAVFGLQCVATQQPVTMGFRLSITGPREGASSPQVALLQTPQR